MATAKRFAAGRTSRMNSSRLRETSTLRLDTPVRLPPGRDRLSTMPSATGSPPISNTIGVFAVADFAASTTSAPPGATMTASGRLGQLLGQRRQPAVLAVGPPVLDGDRAPFGVAGVGQAFAEGCEAAGVALRRFRAEIADDRQALRPGPRAGQRRRGRRTAGKRDEAAPPQAIGGVGKSVARAKRKVVSPPPVSLGIACATERRRQRSALRFKNDRACLSTRSGAWTCR